MNRTYAEYPIIYTPSVGANGCSPLLDMVVLRKS